ncbi:MAG TPA: fatty acid desaturase family protein [Myxococcota bacterium]|nr:fatty acid desaturase family protein [Myxococcota bacterium]
MSASTSPQEVTALDAVSEAQRLAAGYTSAQRLLEISGVTLFFGLCVTTVAQLSYHCIQERLAPVAVAAVALAALVAGQLGADFASGFVHWAADNWGHESWPIVGAAFIRPFRHHHVDPQDICHHPFVELNGNNCLVSLPLFGLGYLGMDLGGLAGFFVGAFFLSLACWVLGTNQFHAWAHAPNPPRVAQALQSWGLILSKPHHEVHHTRPHNGNYCITTGWLNRPLRVLRFFELLEASITRITGVLPNHRLLK